MMAAVWMRFGAELRERWRSWLSLAILVGIFGGAVVGAAAGARRTDTVVDRFIAEKQPPDIFFVPAFSGQDLGPELTAKLDLDHLLEFDSVVSGERQLLMPSDQDIEIGASDDPEFGASVFPSNIVEGRLPDPRRPDEAFANINASQQLRLHAGDTYTVEFLSGWFAPGEDAPPPGPTVTFTITGVGAHLGDFAAIADSGLTLTPAFLEKYRGLIEPIELSMLRLKEGTASYDEFASEITGVTQGQTLFYAESGEWDEARQSFGLQAKSLWILAGLLAAVTMLVIGQAVARQTFLDSTDHATLHALGLSQGQLAGLALLRATWIGLVGAVVAVVVAAAASPLTPFGAARLADPDPAFSLPLGPIGLGFTAIVVVVVSLALYPAFRAAASTWDPDAAAQVRPVRLVDRIARIARKPAPGIGVRMAFERGRGRTAVPVRTTITGTAVSVAALAASLVVGASLNRLSEDPALYGWNWDVAFVSEAFNDDPQNPDDGPAAHEALRNTPGVADVTIGPQGGSISVNGVVVEPYGLPVGATVAPPILEGRAPAAPNEVALARKTLRAVGVEIGDTVRVGFQGSPLDAPFRVVGVTVLPLAGEASTLGEGIWVPIEDLGKLFGEGETIPTDRALVRYEPGVDAAALEKTIAERFGAEIQHANAPGTVVDFGRVSQMPQVLAGIVALLAAGTLGHGLLTAIRRRRRDLSILKSLGLDRRQIRTAVGWQATATTLLTLVIGVTLGAIAGRWIWTAMANSTGFVARPDVDISLLALIAVSALLLANVIAILPGRAAARTRPAVVLRTE